MQEFDIALRVAVVSQLLFILVLLVRAGWPLLLVVGLWAAAIVAIVYSASGAPVPMTR